MKRIGFFWLLPYSFLFGVDSLISKDGQFGGFEIHLGFFGIVIMLKDAPELDGDELW
jgi:hypothetical protein